MINDPEIRKLLFKRLSIRKGFSFRNIIEEAPINNAHIRADVVYCSKVIECFEIKSESDSLKRLIPQGWQYQQSFDLVTLVCASKHLQKAMAILPEWWGLIEVTKNGALKSIRRASKNKNIQVLGIAELLNNSEARSLLKAKGIKGTGALPHSLLKKEISRLCSESEVRDWAIKSMACRHTFVHTESEFENDSIAAIA